MTKKYSTSIQSQFNNSIHLSLFFLPSGPVNTNKTFISRKRLCNTNPQFQSKVQSQAQHNSITNVKIAIFIILFSKITLSSQQVYGCFTIIFSTFWDIRKFSLKLLKTDSYLMRQNVSKLRKVSGSGFLKELKYNFNVFI